MAKTELTIRNSTAEFLIFEKQAHADSIEVRYEDETLWLTQKMMAQLFDVESNTITYHLKEVFDSGELERQTTTRKFRVVQTEGSRQVTRNIDHYNLDAVISVGYRVNSIRARADSDQEHMGLTHWANSPSGKILKSDVSVAKNYLSKEELDDLGRIVSAFLDLAESAARRHIPMTMEDWAGRIDRFLLADDRAILKDAGKISMEIAKSHAESEFEKYRIVQDRLYTSDFDRLEAEGNFHE